VLHELRVENLLLIERAELRLAPGLNVLTGETGAGKTVLAHALDLLLGGRARSGIVRPGASEAYVEGAFEITERLREELGERLSADAEEIVLARRVGEDGRTRAYLNGRTVTVGELRDLGGRLLSFYGQHEHRKLTLATAQLEILDELCGPEQAPRLRACARTYAETRRLTSELEDTEELAAARERELDLLEHELREIDAASLEELEHDELLATRERLRRLDGLRSAAGAGVEALVPDAPETPGAVQLVAAAATSLDALVGVDPRLDSLAERLRALVIEAQDLAGELSGYGEEISGEEVSLDAVEERLAAIERLARKHGGTVDAVLEYATRARARHEELAGAEVALARATRQLQEADAMLDEQLRALRSARELAAPRLARAVREQLAALAMGEASFEVALSAREPGPAGGDAVEFLIAPNPGVPAGPLREIASGGELSRVMLALISASASPSADGDAGGSAASRDGKADRSGEADRGGGSNVSAEATLVFDEVDAGIGGHTARAVGERLRSLGEGRQILCITHLPQIASLGERHFSIVKDTEAEPTLTTVVQLDELEVVSELVRMLGAEDQDATARRHARDLRRAA
jgi:DNA repair protein RecN (Recombination protein N)